MNNCRTNIRDKSQLRMSNWAASASLVQNATINSPSTAMAWYWSSFDLFLSEALFTSFLLSPLGFQQRFPRHYLALEVMQGYRNFRGNLQKSSNVSNMKVYIYFFLGGGGGGGEGGTTVLSFEIILFFGILSLSFDLPKLWPLKFD